MRSSYFYFLLFFTGLSTNAWAICTATTGTFSISGTVSGCYDWQSGNISIASGAVITSSSADAFGTSTNTALGTLTNQGTITAGSGFAVLNNQPGGSTITAIDNRGSMSNSGTAANIFIYKSVLSSLTNSGVITQTSAVDNNGAVEIAGSGWGGIGAIGTLTNTGTISSVDGNALSLYANSSLTSLINTGYMLAQGALGGFTQGAAIFNDASIGTITNTGVISSSVVGGYGIINSGTIGTLNNAQGAAGALTYKFALPTNYNIIINSASSYGKLAVTSGSGSTSFGIYTGSTVSNNTKYTAVLSGLTATQVTNTSGTYGGYSWNLGLESGSTDIWDLIFGTYTAPVSGPSVANTNQSLVNTASALQGTYTLQNSVIANSFTYDCNVFGANNVCVSAGGRNTALSAANGLNNTSALLIAAYRPHPNYRIGAYADQNLSVSNPGGTVNLGNNTPLLGLFGAWSQRLNGTGAEVKVSAAYGQKNTTITRSVVGSGDSASEAGSGSSNLISQGAQVTAKYGFGIMDNVIVSPYVGVRYTQNNMGGYTETTSSSVTAPLTYSALNTNATTALAGVGASYRVIPTVTTFASAGVETDTNTANGTYSATNASIGTLTPVNFNANPVKTRPTATVGAYYDIEKNQRLGITGIYRQEAYQAVSTTTVMATYTIGL